MHIEMTYSTRFHWGETTLQTSYVNSVDDALVGTGLRPLDAVRPGGCD